jgi:hypothetical protein
MTTIHDAASAAAAWVRGEREAVGNWCCEEGSSSDWEVAMRVAAVALELDKAQQDTEKAWQTAWALDFLTYMRDGGAE